jgi:hypothetical protein
MEIGERMNQDRKETKRVNKRIKDIVKQLEESFIKKKKIRKNEDRKLQERIKEMEEALQKERKNREVLEKEMETEKKVKEEIESEKEMEMKAEAAMEQIKILDLDFGSKCGERKQLVENAVRIMKEKVSLHNKKECDKILNGVRVYLYIGQVHKLKEFKERDDTHCAS